GNDLRVYVIKYRKQDKYKNMISGEEKNCDYSYLNSCASDPAHVYDISTESELKSALKTIATDLKTFANYQTAKLVTR
ncbi:MAG: hypothetical protein LBJ16_03965, partial [Holosporaceae bacterium]|nr:hypothetical protein [Holosporaceae bacterium]